MHFRFDGVTEDTLTLGDHTNELSYGRMRRRGKTMTVKVKTKPNDLTMTLSVGIKDSAKCDEFIEKWKGTGVWI